VIRDRDAARETDCRDDGSDQASHLHFASLPPSDHGVRPNYGVYGFRVRTPLGLSVSIRSLSLPWSNSHVA
jgi:hypothetical protein